MILIIALFLLAQTRGGEVTIQYALVSPFLALLAGVGNSVEFLLSHQVRLPRHEVPNMKRSLVLF